MNKAVAGGADPGHGGMELKYQSNPATLFQSTQEIGAIQ